MPIPAMDAETVPFRLARAAAALLVASAGLGGCARGGEPATFAVPRAAVADIRMTCPPGASGGTARIGCLQPLRRSAPAQ